MIRDEGETLLRPCLGQSRRSHIFDLGEQRRHNRTWGKHYFAPGSQMYTFWSKNSVAKIVWRQTWTHASQPLFATHWSSDSSARLWYKKWDKRKQSLAWWSQSPVLRGAPQKPALGESIPPTAYRNPPSSTEKENVLIQPWSDHCLAIVYTIQYFW